MEYSWKGRTKRECRRLHKTCHPERNLYGDELYQIETRDIKKRQYEGNLDIKWDYETKSSI